MTIRREAKRLRMAGRIASCKHPGPSRIWFPGQSDDGRPAETVWCRLCGALLRPYEGRGTWIRPTFVDEDDREAEPVQYAAASVKRYRIFTHEDPRPAGSLSPRIPFRCDCGHNVFVTVDAREAKIVPSIACESCGHQYGTVLCEFEEIRSGP